MILLCTTLIQRQYNVEAHADMSTLIPIRILSTLHYAICHTSKGMWLYTSRGHLPLRCSWLCTKFAKFRSVKNKASSKRLMLCRNTSTLPSPRLSIPSYKLKGKCLDLAWAEWVSDCKGKKIFGKSQWFHQLFSDNIEKCWCEGTQCAFIIHKRAHQ